MIVLQLPSYLVICCIKFHTDRKGFLEDILYPYKQESEWGSMTEVQCLAPLGQLGFHEVLFKDTVATNKRKPMPVRSCYSAP